MRSWLTLAAAILLFPCCADPTEQCIEQYSEDAGYGHDSDLYYHPCADPCESHSGVEEDCAPPSVEQIQAQCYGNGAPCEGAFITREAAICIANSDGLPSGVQGPFADLIFEDSHCLCSVWEVRSVTLIEADSQESVVSLVHAITGEVLNNGSWLGSSH